MAAVPLAAAQPPIDGEAAKRALARVGLHQRQPLWGREASLINSSRRRRTSAKRSTMPKCTSCSNLGANQAASGERKEERDRGMIPTAKRRTCVSSHSDGRGDKVRPRAWPLRNQSAEAKLAHSTEPVPEQPATTWACVLGV